MPVGSLTDCATSTQREVHRVERDGQRASSRHSIDVDSQSKSESTIRREVNNFDGADLGLTHRRKYMSHSSN